MITVEELIKSLKEEDKDRRIRRVEILFDDRDRFAVLRGRIHKSAKLREGERKDKGFIDLGNKPVEIFPHD
jgi:hypothetical protein